MEAQREGLRAAYTTDRLAHRVRVVPKRHVNLLGTERFEVRDSQGNYVTYDRLKRIGYVSALITEGSCQNPRIHAQTTRKQLVKQRVDQINQENGGGGPPSHVVPNVIVNGDRSYEEDDWPSACSTNSAFNTIIGFSGLQ
ncbi:MAG: hypothetical protein Q9211_000221 [Gyalolechia sp. 1 TL-2023]